MHADDAIDRLRELVRIPTVSHLDPRESDWAVFDHFVESFERLYPLLHATLDRELVAAHTMLFRWRGRVAENPAVLMAHYDVVVATEDGWQHPPFAAEITGEGPERVLWGRGTLDDKGALAAIAAAVEGALHDGIVPEHDIYLSFGHDEETAGVGAVAVVDLLESRGVRPRLVLDEGGAIVEGIFPAVTDPIAVVGVSEKGIMSVRLVVDEPGGHASTPPAVTATSRLARAIVRLESKPFPARLDDTAATMIRTIGARATGALGWIYRNVSLTRPLLLAAFTRISPETNAMTRTTRTVTMLSGSGAANAIAERATAIVNVRIVARSTVAQAVEHLRRSIRDDRVRLEILHPSEPSPVSPSTGASWQAISDSLGVTHPGTIVTPYVQNGATDSRHFTRISSNVYRFTPFEMSRAERDTLHAIDERIHLDTFVRGIGFYRELIGRL